VPRELAILFQDASLAVVDKPSGMLVHRGWGNDPVVAMTLLRDQLGRHVFPLHRLDTAGPAACWCSP
jgi:tRNA pseudouridine65 synthase